MRFRRKNKSPAVLSHEFVIQNHADAASFLVMVFLLGLIVEAPAKNIIIFVAVQYNVTYTIDDNSEQFHFYDYGPKDFATIFFYMLVAINLHAVIQEYILDKINRRLHLSKTKHSKFNESGQLAFFYLFSFIWGASILNAEEFMMNPTSLWKDYPHSRMLFQVKFFYICQIAYWLHALLELYFQRIRKEDIPRQLCYICLYIAHISGAYILNLQRLGLILMVPHYLVELIFHASRLFYFSDENKQKGPLYIGSLPRGGVILLLFLIFSQVLHPDMVAFFTPFSKKRLEKSCFLSSLAYTARDLKFTIWALLFVMVRLLTLTLSVLTFGFGLARVENPGFSIANGNFNVLPVRIGCLGAVCLTQAWMMWKFINFQLKKWREHVKNQIPKKKITNTKNKRTKKEPNRATFVNGAAKSEGGASPRIRKSKPV